MAKLAFLNLPVNDLPASMRFYEALGFKNNPQFTDATAACMVWSETFFVMLLTREKWAGFTKRPIPPATSSELMLALTVESRAEVDTLVTTAGDNGGTADVNAVQDLGFMYSRSFLDLDGHIFELSWMDPAAMGG